MEKAQHIFAGTVLLIIFALFLGWYFLESYIGHRESLRIEERMFTAHDDLLAIDGRQGGRNTAVGKFGLIFLTQDGGKYWQRRPSGTAKALSAVSFADEAHGFAVGSGGVLLASDDGGVSWRPQNSGTKDQLLGVHASSPAQIFAVGAFGTLLSTSDGGRSWSRHQLKWDSLIERIIKEGGFLEPNLNAIDFSSPENGWIVGEFGLVLHSKDGGESWVSQRYGSDFPQLYAVKFIDDRRGWAIGQAGSFIQTTDGGRHWSSVEVDTKRDLYGISLEGEHGVVIGDRVIFVSRDGGSSWKPMHSGAEEQLLNSVALKSNEAIAVGPAGTIRLLILDFVPPEKEKQAQ
jgi:photosystem II stability/assembly factor-like uncharacterized protein